MLTLRAVALFGAGAVATHQLRYAIVYGDAAPRALAAHNHGYMNITVPALATLFVIAFAAAVIRIARGRASNPGRRTSLLALWLCCALALGTFYGVQETLEGAGALAGGGWIGFALAFPSGFLVALALRGADAAELPGRSPILCIRVVRASRVAMRADVAPPRLVGLLVGARAPPAAFVV